MSARRRLGWEATARTSTPIGDGHVAHHKVRVDRFDQHISTRALDCVAGCGTTTTSRTDRDEAVCPPCQAATGLRERGVKVDDVVAERYPAGRRRGGGDLDV